MSSLVPIDKYIKLPIACREDGILIFPCTHFYAPPRTVDGFNLLGLLLSISIVSISYVSISIHPKSLQNFLSVSLLIQKYGSICQSLNPRYVSISLDVTSNFLRSSANNFFIDDWFVVLISPSSIWIARINRS